MGPKQGTLKVSGFLWCCVERTSRALLFGPEGWAKLAVAHGLPAEVGLKLILRGEARPEIPEKDSTQGTQAQGIGQKNDAQKQPRHGSNKRTVFSCEAKTETGNKRHAGPNTTHLIG